MLVISVRGTIISFAIRSENSKILFTYSYSEWLISPPLKLSDNIMRSSSSECATSDSEIIFKPKRPANARADPFRARINGYITLWNSNNGPDKFSVTDSAF